MRKKERKKEKVYCQGYNFAGLEIAPIKLTDKGRAEHHFKIYDKYKSEIPWFEKICDWCKEHNQKLYLINSPERSDYKQVIDELKGEKDILKELKDIAKQYDVSFYDFNDDFNDEDMADSDHLNFNGAVKMTRKIAEVIK